MNLRAVTIGQYFPGDSLIHRLDPRTKIVAVILLSLVIFLPKSWPGLLMITLLGVGTILLSRVSFRLIWNGLKPILIFLAITLIFNAFFTPGEPLFHIGSWTVTKEGVILSLITSLKLVLLISMASLLTLTTSPIRLTDGLESLLRPFGAIGVPAHELALMMTIALRFIPTLVDEADRIVRAQSARGGDFQSGNMLARARSLIPVMIPLFVATFRRADELATAMEARGYRGGQGRTKMKELAFAPRDGVSFAVLLLFALGILFLRLTRIG